MKQEVLHHFQSFLGTPKLVLSEGNIDVYQWANSDNPGHWILTTVGMAEDTPVAAGAKVPKEVELMMYGETPDVATLAQIMSDMAAYPKRVNTRLHWWHVVPLGCAIVPDSQLRHILFTLPPFDDLEVISHTIGDKRVDLVWMIPITDAERSVFETEGTDALEDAMEEKETPVSDLFRKSLF